MNTQNKYTSIFPDWFELEELLDLGWIRVFYIGEENFYFEYQPKDSDLLSQGFCKVG